MLPPCNTPYSVLPASLVLACLKDVWSGIETLKDLAQTSSTTAAASGHILPVAGPLFAPTNTAAMLLGARLVFLHAAVLGCAGWFLRATSVVITEPDWCGSQRNRAFY